MDEEAPLINRPPSTTHETPEKSYWSELASLAGASLPIAISFGLQNAVQAGSILMVGTLGTFELGVASYGYMFASCTGNMVAIGGATALDTLCGQAIKNQETNPHTIGVYLQRALLILGSLFMIVIAPLWWYSGPLFQLLGQDADFAMATGIFMRVLIPGGLLQVVAECLKKFLQVQEERHVVASILAISTVIGMVMNFVLVQHTSLRLWGAPFAMVLYHLSTVVLLSLFLRQIAGKRETWGGWTLEAFRRLDRMTILSITGILTVATEWWSFEILAIMAARLDLVAIGAQSILMASDLLFATVSLGIGVASSHRIGNLLGSNNPSGAKFAYPAPYILSVIIGLIELVAILATRQVYGYLFSNDQAVVELTARILPLMAGFQTLDLANGGAGGILRGAGKNHISGICNVVAYYGVGLPTAWYACFRSELGLFGLWLGIVTGSLTLFGLQSSFIVSINWEREASRISDMVH